MTQNSVLQSQLRTAGEIWAEIEHIPYPADAWLRNYFHHFRKKFGSRDRRFFSETIFTLFRHKTLIEKWVEYLNGSSVPGTGGTPSEFRSSEGVPPVPGTKLHVTIAAAMEGFISIGGCDELLREKALPPNWAVSSPLEELSILFSFPLWLVERWVNRYGFDEAKAFLKISNERPPLTIRVNPIRMTRERQMERFRKQNLRFRPTLWSHYGIVMDERMNLLEGEDFQRGFFEVQDEGSQLICEIMNPKEGEVIWDVCAGGGGKSLFLAGLMKNKGRIIATDIRRHKLDDLKRRAARSEIFNIFPADLERISETKMIQKGVDKILIDAPCSGSGTLRRNPDAKWKLSEATFKENQKDQIAIIERSLPHLRAGGELYYVTCSIEPEENEEVAEIVLKNHPELRKSAINLPDVLRSTLKNGFVRLWPPRHHTDGFFMAKLQKAEEGPTPSL